MNDKSKFKNIIGKIGAIIFISIVVIVSLTFVGCMLESGGDMNEGTGSGAVWWLFLIIILLTGIPFLATRSTFYNCSCFLLQSKEKWYKNE